MGQDRQSILVGVAIAAALAGTAHGQRAPSKRAEAVKHFEQGEAYFLAAAYDRAAAEYQAAYRLVPKPGLLFNIGLCREKLGDAALAIEVYRRYLLADPRGNKSEEARARIAALEKKIVEEREAARAAEQQRKADQQRAAEERRAEREQRRRAQRAAMDARHREQEAVRERPRLLPGLLLLGGAAGAGAVGLAYQLRAGSIRDELDRELANGTPPLDSRDPRFDQGRSAALRSSIAYGVAGAAAAVGGFLTVRALLARRSGAAEVSVSPQVGTGGAGAALEVAW